MKLTFCDIPNFGDQLNKFIFPGIFADLLNEEDDIEIYGIGSIIDSRINLKARSILFGTGLRDPFRDYGGHNWDIRFLRGPLSVRSLGQESKYIADAAYLLLLIDDFNDLLSSAKKRHRISLMPYYSYAQRLPWRQLCSILGIHYIDPAQPAHEILSQIAASELVVSGAMHGVIVADICRVPWIRLRMDQYPAETQFLSEFKWADWAGALDIEEIPCVNISSVTLRSAVTRAHRVIFLLEALSRLRPLKRRSFQLSKDEKLLRVKGQLDVERRRLLDDYSKPG